MASANSLFSSSTFKHLRFLFSWHLLPVFLFALSQAEHINWYDTAIAFIVLHLFIYPSSNGYNSYQDRDEGSIGGLKNPPPVNKNLLYASMVLDVSGILLSLLVSVEFSVLVLIYVLVSRAYSFRGIRLKKHAFTGFLTVFIFQGAFTYMMSAAAFSDFQYDSFFQDGRLICMLISSLFIGSVYPLTQIYQHVQDKKDGVITISYLLGFNGTFIFSAVMFTAATALLMLYFDMKHERIAFFIFAMVMLPVMIRLLKWFSNVRKDVRYANFENTMAMNLLASSCMNFYFLLLILNSIFHWF
jgi:1,4-dihydroxy-2-naphthoate octaprenyltransferase